MKVLLINPPFQRLQGIINDYFPLGLGYLAGVAAEKGHDVRIYNAEFMKPNETRLPEKNMNLLNSYPQYINALKDDNHPVWLEVAETLTSFQPDVVGITIMTPFYDSAKKVSALCKKFSNKCTVVWGGVHPTLRPEEVLTNESAVDFIVRGEGEFTFCELLAELYKGSDSFSQIDGLSFRENGTIRNNKNRALITDLDAIPFPRKDLLLNSSSDESIFGIIAGSRGCAFNCGYCSSVQMWQRKVRYRSIENIINEIMHIKSNFKVSELKFVDDTFSLNAKWTTELCQAMVDKKIDLLWWCNTRADYLDEDILAKMKRAGCNAVVIGIETASENTLAYINRRLKLEDITNASRLLSKAGLNWYAYFMIGFPLEKREDIQKTIDMMRTVTANAIQFSIFNPYPGSALFDLCQKEGLLPDPIVWSKFSHHSPENHFMKYIDKETFKKIIFEVGKEVDKINHSFKSQWRRFFSQKKIYFRNPLKVVKKIKDKIIHK
jgi:radical SAM superfamily enzyme YgiQ (UPF0313 family)